MTTRGPHNRLWATRAAGVVALLLIAAWVAGERLPSRQVASSNGCWAAEWIAGRVNLHWAHSSMLYVPFSTDDLNRRRLDCWNGWFVHDGIPVVGSLFLPERQNKACDQNGMAWLPRLSTWHAGHHVLSMPLWLIALPLGALWLRPEYRRWTSARAHVCGVCGYSRAGLAGVAPCPECGSAGALGE